MVRVGVRLYTIVACTRFFALVVSWNKLEKADAQISVGSVVFLLFNNFGLKRLTYVFANA